MIQSRHSERPARARTAPLTADLAVVPLVTRRDDPRFASHPPRVIADPMEYEAEGPPERPPTPPRAGYHFLPDLRKADAIFFAQSLQRLQQESGRSYVDPTAVKPPSTADVEMEEEKADSGSEGDSIISFPRRVPSLHLSLVHLGLKNEVTGSISNLVLSLSLPLNPFAAQIIKAFWESNRRV
ncbi:hypothetical protein FB45DRAFT_1024794 [Roridomyces roridus]|uniref:Uncharacterized protein n=1 Tax=Roridomyces roridus TaxID=1738132 RepID=A0AAD7C1U8_9AGAR|nr:hypothetical protein FB45DRAFT_1024794 [Roridomyces roridus]